MRNALLLVNVGTPDRPDKPSVKRFLKPFLNDKYVIDIPLLARKLLVNGIIIPFRLNNSTELYKRLWTSKGSPLLYHQNSLRDKLNHHLSGEYTVYSAMRYGNPSVEKALLEIKKNKHTEIKVLPMYPQYATSTTLSTIKNIESLSKKLKIEADISFVDQFYNHPKFIEAFTTNILAKQPDSYDHVIFSYHGLPIRQVEKLHPQHSGTQCICEKQMPDYGSNCYKATCYQTTRLLAAASNIDSKNYSVSFQSRLSKNWLTPFTDELLMKLLADGKKKILVVAPAFVTDCLETIVEISYEYEQDFLKAGGEKLTLVESLNDSDHWVKAITNIIN